MLEIKFRGKDIETKEWIYGYYVCILGQHKIINSSGQEYFVDGDTVGQYTGDRDLSKKEIYQGDIVRYCNEDGIVTARVIWKEADDEGLEIAGFYYEPIGIEDYPEDYDDAIYEVIGDVTDNPELLTQ